MVDKYKKGKRIYTHWDKKSEQVTIVKKKKVEQQLPPKQSINVNVPGFLINGIRPNIITIHHNENEFIFDFFSVTPDKTKGRLISRVIMSPRKAKLFMAQLEKKINAKEKH